MASVLKIWQPIGQTPDQNGDAQDSGLADYLMVKIDRYDDSRILTVERLLFSDYEGLEAEWLAQEASTILESSITTLVHTMTFPSDQLSAAQRSIVDVNFTES